MHDHQDRDQPVHTPDHAPELDNPSAGRLRFGEVDGPTSQLEPDRSYILEIYRTATEDWTILAGIFAGRDIERWQVDVQAAAQLASATQLRLSQVAVIPGVANAVPAQARTEAMWASTSSPSFPAGFTFTGAYIYLSSAGSRTSGTLALTLQTSTLPAGGAAITATWWANPDTGGTSGRPVQLTLSGGSVLLHASTAGYLGSCYVATAPLSYP
jgi:hypothetical protein